jgi:hypothetical protein
MFWRDRPKLAVNLCRAPSLMLRRKTVSQLKYLDVPGGHEVSQHPTALSLIGNVPHGVVQVPVKAGKEPEAVLGRAPVLQEETAGLTADYSPALIDVHLEAALGKLIGSGQARYARTQDYYLIAHRLAPILNRAAYQAGKMPGRPRHSSGSRCACGNGSEARKRKLLFWSHRNTGWPGVIVIFC